MFSSKKILIVGVAVAALAGVALATGGVEWLESSGLLGQERALKSRVEGYWSARVAADTNRMAVYISPGANVPDPGMLMTESFSLDEIAVEGDQAEATLSVRSRVRHPLLAKNVRESKIVQRWVRVDGAWYVELGPTIWEAIREDMTANDKIARAMEQIEEGSSVETPQP